MKNKMFRPPQILNQNSYSLADKPPHQSFPSLGGVRGGMKKATRFYSDGLVFCN